NTNTGVEQFAFMPEELLDNVAKLKANASTSSSNPLPYGMDSPVTLWVNDANGDGKVLDNSTDTSPQTGEFVYAYATMGRRGPGSGCWGRGGRGLDGRDVGSGGSPRMLGCIGGGATPGLAVLAQTWSAPAKPKLKVGTTATGVRSFAGGGETNLESLGKVSP